MLTAGNNLLSLCPLSAMIEVKGSVADTFHA